MVTEVPDIEIIKGIQEQRVDALRTLYDRHHRGAFGLAYRITGDAQAAEEIVQDVFQTIWQRAASFDVAMHSNVKGWLMTIAHRRSIDWLRSRQGKHRNDIPLDQTPEVAVPDIGDEVSEKVLASEIRDALQQLPVDQRTVIELAYFDGKSQSEIAIQTETALGTVKGRMRLGLKKLSTLLVNERRENSQAEIGGKEERHAN